MGEKSKRKMATWKKVVIGIVIAILVIIVLGAGYVYAMLNKTNKVELNKNNLGINEEAQNEATKSDITNIALFGIDAPQGQVGRSDADMILTIDNKHNKIKLTSLMRDSYVNVKGHGMTKLTHAYAYGGPELALNTINTNFDLNIDKFITVNFTSLPNVINKLGGIDMNITKGDLKYINGYIDDINKKDHTNSPHITSTGMQHLDGVQATAYCRIRYDGGDQRRTERQRRVITAVFDKIKNSPVTDYPGILNQLLPLVTTNISSNEFISLGKDIIDTGANKIDELRVPCDKHENGKLIKGVYYMTFDIPAETKELHKFIFEN
ncbi:LCP family protein [Clostridium sp.]|uniref:LCP family protein n=1 Tax=Clostridium sp. TaxID=1506 RepID=UPI0026DACFF3|nr:LCP family protein [Clostridium sp.]MDO5040277.1 LCP family protein [Clostridium sp.]